MSVPHDAGQEIATARKSGLWGREPVRQQCVSTLVARYPRVSEATVFLSSFLTTASSSFTQLS